MTAPALPVSAEQRIELRKMARSTGSPHRKVVQARALLMAADGIANEQIARSCAVDSDTVRRWRARFARTGAEGVRVIVGRSPGLNAAGYRSPGWAGRFSRRWPTSALSQGHLDQPAAIALRLAGRAWRRRHCRRQSGNAC